jgi:hypothetical protein
MLSLFMTRCEIKGRVVAGLG